MALTPIPAPVRRVRELVAPRRGADASDGRLLERFAHSRDEEAFGELVRRHGPAVLGVCRRVLGAPQDAEDAFQACFLVLARKAASVRDRASVGGWLFQVAYWTALRLRRQR